MMKKTCRQCGKPLSGRADKKFCDAYCRNSYNNQNKAEDEVFIQDVNSVLRKNRRILKTLCPEGHATVRKEVLDHLEYNYVYFTGIFRAPTSRLIYYVVYDYAFAPIEKKKVKKVLIVQKQDYMIQTNIELWQKVPDDT